MNLVSGLYMTGMHLGLQPAESESCEWEFERSRGRLGQQWFVMCWNEGLQILCRSSGNSWDTRHTSSGMFHWASHMCLFQCMSMSVYEGCIPSFVWGPNLYYFGTFHDSCEDIPRPCLIKKMRNSKELDMRCNMKYINFNWHNGG